MCHSLLQFYSHYRFKNELFYELLQFDINGLNDANTSFDQLFQSIKTNGFYKSSDFYGKLVGVAENDNSYDVFGDMRMVDLVVENFSLLQLVSLDQLKLFSNAFEANRQEIHESTCLTVNEIDKIIQGTFRLHFFADEQLYQLKTYSQANASVWEDFQHYIGVSHREQVVHFISAGYD